MYQLSEGYEVSEVYLMYLRSKVLSIESAADHHRLKLGLRPSITLRFPIKSEGYKIIFQLSPPRFT